VLKFSREQTELKWVADFIWNIADDVLRDWLLPMLMNGQVTVK